MGLKDKLNSLKKDNDSDIYKPEELQTVSEKEIKKLENTHFKVKLLLNISLDIEEEIIKIQQNHRRNHGKKISKEEIIVNILNKEFKIKV